MYENYTAGYMFHRIKNLRLIRYRKYR